MLPGPVVHNEDKEGTNLVQDLEHACGPDIWHQYVMLCTVQVQSLSICYQRMAHMINMSIMNAV